MTCAAGPRRPSLGALALLCTATALLPEAAAAQAVVQALPDPALQQRNAALRTLARDPRSVPALVDAGQASLALEDLDAALGFFRRAEAVDPADARVKAGLASVMARQGQALEALRLFAEAEAAGAPMRLYAADRGLAFDLVGDNVRAQAEYQASLSFAGDPAVMRRLALSQAIAGDQRASDATLLPMLQRSDLAAYRARAFALAILGKSEEAVSIAETLLPQQLSSRMAPYLRYMPRLTRAQQAAAANLGIFPPAAQIGRDDPALAAYAAQVGVPQGGPALAARGADARLVPSGEPLGRRQEAAQRPAATTVQAVAAQTPPPPAPAPQPAPPPQPATPQPAPVQAVVAAAPPPQPAPQVVQAATPPPQPAPQVVQAAAEPPAAEPPRPAAVLVSALPAPAEAEPPSPSISLAAQSAASPAEPPPPARDFGQAFSDFSLGATRPVPAEGAVDITQIQPRREVVRPPPPPSPPKPPPVPSRQWVQVATGRDTGALAFDWRRIKREAGGLLDRSTPHVARWGQTNRLVVGPFSSVKAADDFVTKLKEKKIDSFRFTSAQGEEVKQLD